VVNNSPCHGQSRKDIKIDALVVILGVILVFLAYLLVRAALRRHGVRTRFFALIAPEMNNLRRTITASGFERISGRVGGSEIDLQIIPDTLTYRKLPCFWLLVSSLAPLPLSQKISLMSRPTGFETFSSFAQLPFQTHPLPASFPRDMALRSENPLTCQEMAFLHRHIGIFNNSNIKELVLSAQGCRITWLLQEAHRGRYLLFREAELDRPPLAWAELAPLLTMLEHMRQDLHRSLALKDVRGDRQCA